MRFWKDSVDINNFCDKYILDEKATNYYIGKNPFMLYKHYKMSVLLNIVTAIVLLFIVRLNFYKYTLCFIIFDVLLCGLDLLLFSKDKVHKYDDVVKQRNFVKKLEKEYDKDYDRTINNVEGDSYETQIAFEKFYARIVFEKMHLDTLLKHAEEIEVKTSAKTSKDYEDKLEYFNDMYTVIRVLSKDFNFIEPLYVAVGKLVEILKKKPEGVTQISKSVYIYLDELKRVSYQILDLAVVDREQYIEQFKKISNLLTEKIEAYIEHISRMESTNIEVSLSVLLSELQSKEGGEE